MERISDISQIQNAVSTLDAAGNDIFISGDIAHETLQINIGNDSFNKNWKSLLSHLENKYHFNNTLKVEIEDNVKTIYAGASKVFLNYRLHNITIAAAEMAKMDQAYAKFLKNLDILKKEFSSQAFSEISIHEQHIRSTKIMGFVILVLVFLCSLFSIFVGRLLQRKFKHDLILQKRLTNNTSRKENFTRQLLDSLPVGLYQTDLEGKCHYVNKKWSEISGLTNEEAKGYGWARALHPDDRAELTYFWEEFTQGRENFDREYRFLRHDKKITWVKAQATAMKDVQGRVIGFLGSVLDISKEKSAREVLNFYKSGIDQTHIVSMTNAQGVIFYVNDKFCELSGYSSDELCGKTHRMVNANYHSDIFFMEMWESISNGRVWRGDVKNKNKNGTYYWVDSVIIPFLDSANVVQSYVSVRRDITAEKFTQQEKAKTDELNKLTLAAINDGIWDWDLVTNQIKYSDRWLNILGYNVGDIENNSHFWKKTIHPNDLDKVMALLEACLNFDIPFAHISSFMHKNGRFKKLMCRSSTVKGSDEKPLRMVCSFTDVTDFANMNKKLDESTSKLTLTLEASGLGTWDYHFETQVLKLDQLVYNLIQASSVIDPRELFDKSLEGGFETFLKEISKQAGFSGHVKLNTRLTRMDGQIRIFSFEAKAFYNDADKLVQLIGICRDDTDKINNELILHHQSKMASLGEMAGGMAHEINNPLSIIYGNAEKIISLSIAENIQKDELNFIGKKIVKTVDRIVKTIKGLKSFSRQGEGDPFEEILVARLLEDTFSLCDSKLRNHQVDLQLPVLDNNLSISCRPVQISQVILNLVNNSFDAIQDSPSPWVRVEVEDSGDKVLILIIDSGTGISDEIKEKIMQPFFTTKAKGQGTGLGLSIVRKILHAHQGEMYIKSATTNTTFVISLPKKLINTFSLTA